MSVELKDWLNNINHNKKNLIDDDPDLEKKYLPYIINRCMSGHLDAIMYANEMNIYHNLDNKLQHDFLLNILRSKKRFSPWVKKEELQNLDYVKRYYGYSNEKAKQVLPLLSKEQLNFIQGKLERGGLK